MTTVEAVERILEEFNNLKCEYDTFGKKVATWIVENKSNKEEHIADLYRADVLDDEKYRAIYEYLFVGADDVITHEFLCRNAYERKIAAVKYLKK